MQCGLSGNRVVRKATPCRSAERGTASIGNERCAVGKSNPYLSRKIYFFCCRRLSKVINNGRGKGLARTSNGGYFLSKKTKSDKKGGQSTQRRWVVTAFCLAVALSAALSLASEAMLSGAGLAVALFILALFILLGIAFDIIGVAVTAADPRPFHSMAAHKVKGAKDSLKLIKNASTVSSVCNDVVGDICGIVSGTTTTVIVVRLQLLFDFLPALVLSVGLTALVSGFTIGGKALGKTFAMKSSTKVVYFAGRVLSVFHR